MVISGHVQNYFLSLLLSILCLPNVLATYTCFTVFPFNFHPAIAALSI